MSKTTNKFSPEVRERAVRMVPDNPGQRESRWQAIVSVSAKIVNRHPIGTPDRHAKGTPLARG